MELAESSKQPRRRSYDKVADDDDFFDWDEDLDGSTSFIYCKSVTYRGILSYHLLALLPVLLLFLLKQRDHRISSTKCVVKVQAMD